MAFTTSALTDSYLKKLQETEAGKPGDYQSKYQNQIDGLLDDITNRKKFSYDFNADPLYQQIKDSKMTLGKQAAQNAVAASATMTGGYGNSYGTTAAAQANQQYVQQINDMIPDLYNVAAARYDAETERLKNNYSMFTDADSRDYSKYRDTVSDWNNNRSYYQNAYNGSYSNDMSKANYDESVRQFDENQKLAREQFEWQKAQAAKASSGSSGSSKKSSSSGSSTKVYGTSTDSNDSKYADIYNNIQSIRKNMTGGSRGNAITGVTQYLNNLKNEKVITTSDYNSILKAFKNGKI